MISRTGTWVLTVALLLGCVGCDDDNSQADEGASMSGRGGRGSAGDGGQAGREGPGDGGPGGRGTSGDGSQAGRGGSGVGGPEGRGGSGDGGRAGGDSGVGGLGGREGSAGQAGVGGGGGNAGGMGQDCSLTRDSLQKWCGQAEAGCDVSATEQLDRLCREQDACASCAHVGSASNSCGGASISATYGVDVHAVIRHYDAQGQLVGTEAIMHNRCIIDMRLAPVRIVYGAECKLSNHHAAECPPAADGGM